MEIYFTIFYQLQRLLSNFSFATFWAQIGAWFQYQQVFRIQFWCHFGLKMTNQFSWNTYELLAALLFNQFGPNGTR